MKHRKSSIWTTIIQFAVLVGIFLLISACIGNTALGQTSRSKAGNGFTSRDITPQPLFTEYKGVKLGMTEAEVREKLGQGQRIDDALFYAVSDNESVQVAFDKEQKVTAISIDYQGGTGAPDYKTIVGNDIEVRPDGSLYKIVHYEKLGYWVSYNRTGRNSTTTIVSITIQRLPH